MPLVIGSGPSVSDYHKDEITAMAKWGFTFGVNETIFDFPCDIVVMLDPFVMCNKMVDQIKKIDKPVICRKWPNAKRLGLDLIEIPNEAIDKYPLSGMAACKISDGLMKQCGGIRKSYVIGIDGGNGNYKSYSGAAGAKYEINDPSLYDKMDLKHTVNMSVHSKVSCWPKISKLPHPKKIIVPMEWRIIATGWIKAHAAEVL